MAFEMRPADEDITEIKHCPNCGHFLGTITETTAVDCGDCEMPLQIVFEGGKMKHVRWPAKGKMIEV